MQLLPVAAWQEVDSLAARARLLRFPVICCTSQEAPEKLDLGKKFDRVIPEGGGDIGCL